MTTPRARSAVALVVSAVLLAACGSGGGSSGDRLSDEAFCARLDELEQGDTLDDTAALAEIAALADRAPDEQLGRALRQIASFASTLDALDEDDEEAFGEAMALLFDPRNLAAIEQLETYLTDTCGFDMDAEPDETGTVATDGTAWDDLDSSSLHDALRPAIAQHASGTEGSGVGMYGRGRGVVVELQVYDSEPVDAIALCEALAAEVDRRTADPGIILEIVGESVVLAERLPGGTCRVV